MLKIYKNGQFARKIIQLKHLRKYGEKCDPCRRPCPPSYVCKQPKCDEDFEAWLREFDILHPFLTCHKPKDYKPFKNMTLFFCLPLCLIVYFSVVYMAQPRKRPKFINYEYMRIRRKMLPWSREGKSLFHNPYYNALPDGYEFEVSEAEEYDPRSLECPPK